MSENPSAISPTPARTNNNLNSLQLSSHGQGRPNSNYSANGCARAIYKKGIIAGKCLSIAAIPCFLISITIAGIIVVCLTANKTKGIECQYILNVSITNLVDYDSRPQAGVVADLNNDTILDIVVANPGTDTIGIFIGDNNGTFQDQVVFWAGFDAQPVGVIVADFNNDNIQDIVAVNFGTNSIGLMTGDMRGTFADVIIYSLESFKPVSGVTADINNDTYPDIILISSRSSSMTILIGYGDGSFARIASYSTGYDSFPYSIVVRDLNRDHRLDIVVANFGTGGVTIFWGYDDGSFSPYETYSTGIDSYPTAVIVDDLNDDHLLDIVVCNYGSSYITSFLGQGGGKFQTKQSSFINSTSPPYSMVVGDFDNDKIQDVAVANPGSSSVMILHGSGDGKFVNMETYSMASESTPVYINAGDFDGNGRLDLATMNNGSNRIHVLLRYKRKKFTEPVFYSTGPASYPYTVAVGDINQDEILDIFTANQQTDSIGIFLGHHDGTFIANNTLSTGYGSAPKSVVIGDFNHDNLNDLAVANWNTQKLGIILGRGAGNFQTQLTYTTGTFSNPIQTFVGDFNSDNFLDAAVVSYTSNNVGIFLGNGDGTFQNQMISTTGRSSAPLYASVGNFNHDTNLDIAVCNYYSNTVAILLGFGNGTFQTPILFYTGQDSTPQGIAVGDFNNDGTLDLAVANTGTFNVLTFFGFGNGSFIPMAIYDIGDGSRPAAIFVQDFNNDNISDIAVVNSGSNDFGILFGYHNGTFGMLTTFSTGDGSRPNSMAIGNFNRDKWLDVAIANLDSSNIGVFLGLDVVGVADQASYASGSGSHPVFVLSNDFNNDSLLDLLIVRSAHDNVAIRLGYRNGTFAKELLHPTITNSLPQHAVVGDFNRDLRQDIAIVNTMADSVAIAFGLGDGTFTKNKVYSLTAGSRPCFAVSADVNNDTKLDLLVLNQNANNIGVFLAFDYTTFSLPDFYSTGAFSYPIAIATGDFNNDQLTDIVSVNRDTSQIGIFLGYGNGTFEQQVAYSTGFRSSPYALATADFNNDSFLDVAAANYNTDSIVILLGYGNGTMDLQDLLFTGTGSRPISVVVDDFNNDNIPDIAVANYFTANVGVFLGHGNAEFSNQIVSVLDFNSSPHSLDSGDLNNDTIVDIAVADYTTSNILICLGFGNGSFSVKTKIQTDLAWKPQMIAIGDFNNDLWPDIVVASSVKSSLCLIFGYGNAIFTSCNFYSTGRGSLPQGLAIDDLNHDNKLDIVVANYGSNNVGVFFGYGNGLLSSQMLLSTGSGSQPAAVALGDFTNNNRSDIAVANFRSWSIAVFNYIDFQPFLNMISYSIESGSSPTSMVVADFNKDSRLDVAVANNKKDNIGLLLGYGDGSFTTQTTYSTGTNSKPYFITAVDFNGDTFLDIVVTNSGNNNVGILFGTESGTFSSIRTYPTGDLSSPRSLAISDFTNDGCLDIIVTNLAAKSLFLLYGQQNGTITSAQSFSLGYKSQPYSIAVGDFNRDNWTDVAVADYGTDALRVYLQICDSS